MKQLTAEQISQNWNDLMSSIDKYISEPRKAKIINFYKQYEERICMMPASHKTAYHNCGPGGYVDHVNRVILAALKLDKVWRDLGVINTYSTEELVFSALNHDLGKMGTKEEEMYLPNTSQWHVDNKGEVYEVNHKLSFMSVPDRSLYLLTQHGIEFSENEYLAIKLHDGVYDEANKPYLMSYLPETKPRTSLVFIIHQADMIASRIEFEHEWLPKFLVEKPVKPAKKGFKSKQDGINKTFKDMKISPEIMATLSKL